MPGDLPVVGHAGAVPHQHRMPAAMAVEHFLARQGDLHRPIQQHRRFGDDDLVVERVALAAKPAAVGRRDDANVRGGQLEHLRQRAMQVVRRLGARVDDQLAVRILHADRRVLLERQVGVALEEKQVVEDVIRAGDRRVHVAKLQRDDFVDVALVAVLVDPRRRMGQRLLGRRDRAQRLVLDLDQRRRAAAAVTSSRAITAATGSPTKRTTSGQSACSS